MDGTIPQTLVITSENIFWLLKKKNLMEIIFNPPSTMFIMFGSSMEGNHSSSQIINMIFNNYPWVVEIISIAHEW
jgi:hypothetical protein